MKITIKDKEIELKYSIRALIMYENISESSFTGGSLTEILTFFYCIILTSSKDYSLNWDEFLDWVDTDNNILIEFGEWIKKVHINQNKLKKD